MAAALLLALALTLVLTPPLSGQAREASTRSVALDVSFGLASALESREGADRIGATGALMLSRSLIRTGPAWLVGAVHGSLLGRAAGFVDIEQGQNVGPGRFRSSHLAFGALAGWGQRADQSEGARLLVGPAYFARGESASGTGLIARFDGAKDTPEAIALTFFVETQVTPRFAGKREVLGLIGVGLRVRSR